MWKLLKEIVKEDEGEFTLETNDFFRPNLKQIGNSVFDIRNYYIPKEGVNIIPTSLETPLKEVKERLLELFDLCAFNLIRHDSANTPVSENAVGGGFAFISKSLAPVLDIPTSALANHIRCDVFIALPGHSVLLLTLVDGDSLTEALEYNMSVARGVTRTLSRFMDECVHPVHGVLPVSTLYDKVTFEAHINKIATKSSHFITKDSLLMNPTRYVKVLNAFWAGVAETKCVKTEPGKEDDDSLRFLTSEQCIVLVENINNNDVQVMYGPGTGASTLMLEVARRLRRLGDTLLVCKSEEERDRLRKVYTPTVTVDELSTLDLSPFTGIVDETNETETDPSCSHWRFTNIQEELKNLKMRTTTIKREVDSVKGQIAVLKNDEWEGQMNFLFEEMDVLRMFSAKIKHVMTDRKKNALRHSPFDDLSSPECDGWDLMANWMKPLLVEFKQRIYGQNDVLHSIKEFLAKDKILIAYIQTKIESWEEEQSLHRSKVVTYQQEMQERRKMQEMQERRKMQEMLEMLEMREMREMLERLERRERRERREMQERRERWERQERQERQEMREMRKRIEENVRSLLLRGHNRCSETAAEENFASLEDMNKGDESKEISEGRKTSFSPHSNQSMDVGLADMAEQEEMLSTLEKEQDLQNDTFIHCTLLFLMSGSPKCTTCNYTRMSCPCTT
ncbi:mRNA export factor GLE1-like [Haliotis rubra]|uniref:mRNA export factor GLE1-like n=1 Tax=Haliotis rubra TaxID=36100 RepID=UPI001EE5B4B9|nr:mRNA export factor GLE1-like [Haliotis rubra]